MAAQRIEGFTVPTNCVELVRTAAAGLRAVSADGVACEQTIISGMVRVAFTPGAAMGSEAQGFFTVTSDKSNTVKPVQFREAIRVVCAAFGVELAGTAW